MWLLMTCSSEEQVISVEVSGTAAMAVSSSHRGGRSGRWRIYLSLRPRQSSLTSSAHPLPPFLPRVLLVLQVVLASLVLLVPR